MGDPRVERVAVRRSKLHVSGASNTGIAADLGSTAQLFDTTVDGNQGGIATYAGGAISINGGTVSNSAQFGVSTDSAPSA